MNRLIIFILIFLIGFFECVSQNREIKGIGVAFLIKAITEETSLSDTLKIYQTSALREIKAKMIFNLEDRFERKVVSKGLHENALFEFDYESFGLPILKKNDRHIKVLFGYEIGQEKLVGYIPIDNINYGYRLWNKVFLEGMPIFFNRDLPLQFFDEIKGEMLSIEVGNRLDVPERKDYIMYPLKIEGEWMKVNLVTPSDYCKETEILHSKKVWIKYMDDSCELRVWYYVRGC